jgi:D-sedoheptulose 7-phosphate isomerase
MVMAGQRNSSAEVDSKTDGKISKQADTAIVVSQKETFKIQELHLSVYYTLCIPVRKTA